MKNRFFNQFAVTVLAAVVLAGCGSNNKDRIVNVPVPDPISEDYQGVWVAPGYGLSVNIGTDSARIYQYTTDYCFLTLDEADLDTSNVERLLRKTGNADELEWFSGVGTTTFGPPGYFFERVNGLPNSCQTDLIVLSDVSSTDYDATDLFDMYSQIFEEYYVDFDRNNVNWADVVQTAGAELTSASTNEQLFTAMANTLVPMADSHNYVLTPDGLSYKEFTKPILIEELIAEYASLNGLSYPIDPQILTQQLVDDINGYVADSLQYQWDLVASYAASPDDIRSAAEGRIRWFKNEGLGYLFVGSMLGYSQVTDDELALTTDTLDKVDAILDDALSDLDDVNGLIIDVRTNDGGYDFVSMAIASRFAPSEYHAFSKQARDGNGRTPLRDVYIQPSARVTYHGSIAVLTSSNTVSAAETFVLSMAQLPNVLIVGDATHGALSNVLEWNLPNGFEIGMSNEYYLSANGSWFEGLGIPVDIEVPFFTTDQRDDQVDMGIETAAEILLQ